MKNKSLESNIGIRDGHLRSKSWVLLGLLVAGVLIWGGWAAVQAHRKLVTLNVRNMEVRQAVKKIEWQTWESILVQSNVQGKVTLNVRNVPLEKVLNIIGEQTSSRPGVLYPIYSSRKSLTSLKTILRGESASTTGWTNLQTGGSFRGDPMSPGGGGLAGASSSNQLVSLNILGKDISFAALALNRFAHARLVLEDGSQHLINLTLNKVTVSQAVATVARKMNGSWTRLYTLTKQAGPGGRGEPGGPPQLTANDSTSPRGRRPGQRGAPEAETDEARAKRDELDQKLMETLPNEERQKLEQAQLERKQQMEAMQNLTPEQRRDMAPPGRPDMARAMLDRIKNSTPEQRAQQRRSMAQMRVPGQPRPQ